MRMKYISNPYEECLGRDIWLTFCIKVIELGNCHNSVLKIDRDTIGGMMILDDDAKDYYREKDDIT